MSGVKSRKPQRFARLRCEGMTLQQWQNLRALQAAIVGEAIPPWQAVPERYRARPAGR